MKVKLIHPISGPEGTFKPGDEPELSETLAMSLLRDGHAAEIVKTIEAIKPIEKVTPGRKPARRR